VLQLNIDNKNTASHSMMHTMFPQHVYILDYGGNNEFFTIYYSVIRSIHVPLAPFLPITSSDDIYLILQ